MAEYIEREAALDIFGDVQPWQGYYEPYTADVHQAVCEIVKLVRKEIQNLPAADVAPARHGRIIETVEDGKMKRVFSCCSEDFTHLTMWYTPHYCPNCGAKMDLEERNV